MRHTPAILVCLVSACQLDTYISPKDDAPDLGDSDVAEPDIRVTPERIDFGGWLPGCTSDVESIFVENVEGAPLDVSHLEVRGPGKLSFDLAAEPAILAPGDVLEVGLSFSPESLHVFEGPWIEITSDDPDEPIARVDVFGEGAVTATQEDLFLQEPADAVDVLFSIDYSGSMSEDVENLASHFDTFITQFVDLDLDFHIAVISADPECPEFQGDVITRQSADPHQMFIDQTSTDGCSGEAAFGATKNALQPAMLAGPNAGFLRTNANLAVVAISDEPEQTEGSGPLGCTPPVLTRGCMSVNSYVNFLNGLKGGNPAKVTFSGVVAPKTASLLALFGCSIALPAARYHDAIQKTGGVFGNLCQLQLDPFLTHLAHTAAGVGSTYVLSREPLSVADVRVEVDGVEVPNDAANGWTYDPAANAVTLHGDAVPLAGDAVVITYNANAACNP